LVIEHHLICFRHEKAENCSVGVGQHSLTHSIAQSGITGLS